MKPLFFILAIATVFLYACSGEKHISIQNTHGVEVSANDSVEYDVETFDVAFESWYERQKSPAASRSLSYYETWNHQYVSAWNAKSYSSARHWPFEPVIGYDPTVDYGFDLNHKLFYYFMYVERVLKIKIMSGGPKSIVFY